jgi:hypothetical protein
MSQLSFLPLRVLCAPAPLRELFWNNSSRGAAEIAEYEPALFSSPRVPASLRWKLFQMHFFMEIFQGSKTA